MKQRRFGVTLVEYEKEPEWYIVVTPPYAAICACHGPPHLHRHPYRRHPDHLPRIPLDPTLGFDDVMLRLEELCTKLATRGPEFEELLEAMA